MKRFLSLIAIIVCLLSLTMMLNASENISNIDIIFEEDSSLTLHEKELVREYILTGHTSQQTRGLSCLLFGHEYQTEYIYAVVHMVRNAPPRCDRELYRVNVCTKCEDVQSEYISVSAIYCCE